MDADVIIVLKEGQVGGWVAGWVAEQAGRAVESELGRQR
jgi:hypothetical protein